jgi:mevalonate kinase
MFKIIYIETPNIIINRVRVNGRTKITRESEKLLLIYDENNDMIYKKHNATLKQFEEMCKLEKKKTLEELLWVN